MTYDEVVQKISGLSREEKRQLMHYLVDSLTNSLPEKKTRQFSDFAGIGEELYDETDAQEHVNQLRSEWDDRP